VIARYSAAVLSKYERNEIFELVTLSDLSVADFEPPREDNDGRTRLRHFPTGRWLAIGDEDGEGGREYSLKEGASQFLNRKDRWQDVVETWLVVVAREMGELERDRNTPDLWAEFAREQEALSGTVPAPEDNTSFTADEQGEIERRLHDVANYAAESGKFEDDELQVLNAKIDFLIESSKHSRRFDWREQMVGAFLSAVVGNLLPRGATMDVLNMVVGTVGHLIGHPVIGLPR
jgi:hypothetical protein